MTSEPTAAEVADLLFRASRELRATRRSKLAQECQSLARRLQQPPAPSSAGECETCAFREEHRCGESDNHHFRRRSEVPEGLSSAAYRTPAERLAAMDPGDQP